MNLTDKQFKESLFNEDEKRARETIGNVRYIGGRYFSRSEVKKLKKAAIPIN